AASMRVCHRSGGSKTWESDERTSRSTGISFLTRSELQLWQPGHRRQGERVSGVSAAIFAVSILTSLGLRLGRALSSRAWIWIEANSLVHKVDAFFLPFLLDFLVEPFRYHGCGLFKIVQLLLDSGCIGVRRLIIRSA